jgi:Ca-activated chloride channel family protein
MKYLLTICCFISSFTSFASIASLKGTIIDETKSAMPYVMVELSQNSIKVKNTATNTNGQYVFYDLASGSYTIQCKYIGYIAVTKNITIDASKPIVVDLSMTPNTKNLEAVTVVTGKKDQAESTNDLKISYDKTVVSEKVIYNYDAVSIGTTSGTKTLSANNSVGNTTYAYAAPSFADEYEMPDIYYKHQHDPISNDEDYSKIEENKFIVANENAISTFSIDVDNASYSNIRRMISYNQMPPKDAVRIEEMINYFKYTYPNPTGEDPFAVQTEMMDCPWNKNNKIFMVGMQGKQIDYNQINPTNLVFLVDVSGSMSYDNKLPLVKQSLKILVDNLQPTDKISLVAYAGNAGLVLPSTEVKNKDIILKAIDNLASGGSTAGGAGIKLAYKIAEENFVKGGNNRVVMCTDGDFNVGVSSDNEMKSLIETEREKKIYITMVGFGMGNYKDSKMETIADNGNGNYYYIDNINEATKVFKTDMRATLFTIAKDVKLQIYFNPDKIASYRLIGYENRVMAKEDFDNDKKDAGELGAGHTVTALYEVVLKDEFSSLDRMNNDLSKELAKEEIMFANNDYMILKMRYKKPGEDISKLLLNHLNTSNVIQNSTPSENIQFASSVALFGMLLRGSSFSNHATYLDVLQLAEASKGTDKEGYRKEFIEMIKSVNLLAKK